MLLNYKINNYKYINKEIELDLKTNIFFICGKGNCGKTSILDSIIFAISHIISPAQYILKEQISFYKNFISNFEKDDKRCLFEITIEMNNILYKYGFEEKCGSYFKEYLIYGLITVCAGGITYGVSMLYQGNLLLKLIYNILICLIIPNMINWLLFRKSTVFIYWKKFAFAKLSGIKHRNIQ